MSTPLSILVVDDVPDAADSLAAVLTLHGHRAVAVYAGADALARVAAEPTDVVLLDITMPGMDGFELARRIADVSVRRKPFLVAVTGRSDEEDRQQGRDVGVDMYLVKPIKPELLAGMLDRISVMLKPPAVTSPA